MPIPMPPSPTATPGASPPGGGAPMGGTGPVTAPRPMMGSGAQSMTLVRTGLEALQKSLIGLPMGSDLHTAVLKSITELSKHMQDGGGDKSAQIQALAAMGRDVQANPQAAAMQKMFPPAGGAPGGGAPPAPGGAPPGM